VTGSALHTIAKEEGAQTAVEDTTPFSHLSGQTLELVVVDKGATSHTYKLAFTTNVTETDIDDVIQQGILDVNKKINTTDNKAGKRYAMLAKDILGTDDFDEPVVDWTNSKAGGHKDHTVYVTIDETGGKDVTVSMVYSDIIQTLLDALNKNTDRARSVSVGNEGKDNYGVVTLVSKDALVTGEEIEDLVKKSGLHYKGQDVDTGNVDGNMPILDLGEDKQSVTVAVKATNGETYKYTVKFEVGTLPADE
jgi:hypothetical protein